MEKRERERGVEIKGVRDGRTNNKKNDVSKIW
jgi:hypothetical protein